MPQRVTRSIVVALLSLSIVSCGAPNDERATKVFADCLRRNGIVAEGVEVTMGRDGKVGGYAATVVSEGNVAFDDLVPGCIEEVELNR